ncbi:hypothetical protein [Ferruginibacter sp. SUN106]|uniref:hypothetical protein n=1 Tax=Ferruginibacter sp. SUN106 TaxID=2978348 RepID=UPI003D36BE7E
MTKYLIILVMFFSISHTNGQVKKVKFEILHLKKEIKKREDTYITLKVTNLSDQKLLVPTVIHYNIFKENRSLDFGYEVCKNIGDSCLINDSCYTLSQTLYPGEGPKLKKYKKNSSFYHVATLPLDCFSEKGNYRIRFTYFPKNKSYIKVQTQWYDLKILWLWWDDK